MNANLKRERLIDSAAELFHVKGMLSTSLADIAKHAYPAILVLTVFLCFFLATAVVHLPIWAAAFRH